MRLGLGSGRLADVLRIGLLCFLLLAMSGLLGCRFYSLEPIDCTEARVVAKQFYSLHFGNDMRPSSENLKLRERFLTPEYYTRLAGLQMAGATSEGDPFTPFSEKGPPKTFKIGKCQELGSGVVDFQVQFYWRDDYSTDQRELHADMVKTDGVWLIRQIGTGMVP